MGILFLFWGMGAVLGFFEGLLTGSTIILGIPFTLARSGISIIGQMLFLKLGFNIHYERRNEPGIYVGADTWLKLFGASIMYGLLIFVGFLLLIIPGIYFWIKYTLHPYAIIDQEAGVFESFSESGSLAKGNWWKLFLLSILTGLLSISGILLLGIGVFFTGALAQLVWMHAYLQLRESSMDDDVHKRVEEWLDEKEEMRKERSGYDSYEVVEVEEIDDEEDYYRAPGRSESDIEDLEL